MTNYLEGLDVSHYSGAIDWGRVARDTAPAFVYVKASEGCGTDPRFADNFAAVKANGLLRGAYHLFHPDHDPAAQAQHFLQLASTAGDLAPALDIEALAPGMPDAAYAQAIRRWLDMVGAKLHCAPLLYASASFWNSHVGTFSTFVADPLWIAHYTDAAQPALPTGANGFTFWQYSEQGKVTGIPELIDLNRFNGSTAQLQALRYGNASTVTPTIQVPAERAP